MAKRKTERPKKAAKKAAPKATTKRKAVVKKKPRAQPLPGMEDSRIRELDEVCSSIAETREAINDLRKQETDLETVALKAMRKHSKTAWRHAGVELVRVPGEERLRVRTARDRTATAEVAEDEVQNLTPDEPISGEATLTPGPTEGDRLALAGEDAPF